MPLEGGRGAVAAFKALSGLAGVAAAAPADCGKCQRNALTMPKSWRHQHAKEGCDELLSPNTVSKWSRQLMAAFERAKRGWRICNTGTSSKRPRIEGCERTKEG